MHRHGYQGRKFGREVDQRTALIKGLATSLVDNGKIETTLPKAKEVSTYLEKVITKAKKNDLANRRSVISSLTTQSAAKRLVDVIAPKLSGRNREFSDFKATRTRVGDGAQLAIVEFVDDISENNEEQSK